MSLEFVFGTSTRVFNDLADSSCQLHIMKMLTWFHSRGVTHLHAFGSMSSLQSTLVFSLASYHILLCQDGYLYALAGGGVLADNMQIIHENI